VDSIYITPLTALGTTAIRQVRHPSSTQFDPQTSTKFIRIPQIFEAERFCNALQRWNFVGDLLISFSNVLHMLANLTWQAAAQPLQLLGSGMNRFECV